MPNKRASVKNEKQYEGLRKKGMSTAGRKGGRATARKS